MQRLSLANLLIIGAFVSLISASGGSIAFAKKVSNSINSRKKAEMSMWFGGLFVWFSDSVNSLLVDPVFQSIGDRLKVSREKFAYILDATSSPICALIPIISWGVYIMGLIQSELEAASITNLTSWDVFVKAVPFQFYSWLTLAMVGYVAYTQFDFGPMLKAQKRAETGKVLRDGATPLRNTKEFILPDGAEPKAITMILPLISLLIVMFSIFIMNGFPFEKMSGTTIRQGIAMGFITGGLICVLLSVKLGLMTFKKAEEEVFDGMRGMLYLVVLLTFAWSLGSVCKSLGTAYYIVDLTSNFLNPSFLPLILFIIGALMSLATGSSWGPYAILMPIGISVAIAMGAPLFVTVAAIISGGLFGDHCSPLSDTTILASMGAACDHMDHFQTQFPYALTVALVSSVLFLITGFYQNAIIIFPGLVVLGLLIYVLHLNSMKKYKLSNTKSNSNKNIA
ncbi:MAG: sodium:proton exchanger [Clostridiales bacterium]|nr:sodium:proton exchanger [Clostridiales bacterium]